MTDRAGSRPKAVLFDFGGVITTSPFDAFADHERTHGLPSGFIRSINATNPDTNAWAQLERGEVDLDGFVTRFEAEAEALGHRLDGHEVLACLSGSLRPEMVRAISRLRDAGIRLALLTNNFLRTDSDLTPPDHRPVLDHFEVIIESATAGCRKPDPRFYQLALDALELEATDAIFLDDLGINLKPARAMGMATIKVIDPNNALEALEASTGVVLR